MSTKKGEPVVGRMMLDLLDDFVENLPGQAYSAPGGEQAAASWVQGKKGWAVYKRAEHIDDAVYAARNSNGGDFSSRLRTQFSTILQQNRKRARFSPEETAAMEKFVQGGPISDLLRTLSSGGLPTSLFGGMMAGPGGAAVGALASLGARAGLNRSAEQAAERLAAEVATGGLQIPAVRSTQLNVDPLVPAFVNPSGERPRGYLEELLYGGKR